VESGGTKFVRELGCAKLGSLRRQRYWMDGILNGCGGSLAQPEQEKNRYEPEKKPSQYDCLKPMHVVIPFTMRGRHLQ
jgi:hypothetical protein